MICSMYEGSKTILLTARNKVSQSASFAMVETTWNIAKSINEAQDGHEKGSMAQTY